jgi:hypothetical protein
MAWTDAELQKELVGYLNFSAGSSDPKFLAGLNSLYQSHEAGVPRPDTMRRVADDLHAAIKAAKSSGAAFANTQQAEAIVDLAFEQFPARYEAFHKDLLFHQPPGNIWRPFFLGRVVEAVLGQEGPWDESERILTGAIKQLNDFVGHRPTAVLHNGRQCQPYAHEWIRPIPIYIAGAGVNACRYTSLVEQTLEILRQTSPKILSQAQFDPELLDELAYDPRAYDFDCPANKRPNYQFGMWDPHHIDQRGYYRRYVVQEMVLDSLLTRVEQPPDGLTPQQAQFEAAAALAGTILMGAGTSAAGPGMHDSSVTLATLLPRIAAYRDAFYQFWIQRVPPEHSQRLTEEITRMKQPFGGARHHLNAVLAGRRALQLQNVELALIYGRLGYPNAARKQVEAVAVASARIKTELLCDLTSAQLAMDRGDVGIAADAWRKLYPRLQEGIECGALVDPWNMLGFQGNFSLFPSPENSVHDHRIDELIGIVRQLFAVQCRLWSLASAGRFAPLAAEIAAQSRKISAWWDQFASTQLDGWDGFSGQESHESAERVAAAMQAWHAAGAESAKIGFWRQQVAEFNSTKAYAVVVDALLDQKDRVATMALLVQWVSHAESTPLVEGEYSFHAAAWRWLTQVLPTQGGEVSDESAQLILKFFDFLEANAETFWEVPTMSLEFGPRRTKKREDEDDDANSDDQDELYGAAYEDVIYRDTTDDGQDADMLESGPGTEYELEAEAKRLRERLAFLGCVAQMWRRAATSLRDASPDVRERLHAWQDRADANVERLQNLLDDVARQQIPSSTAARESLLEYDRRRQLRDMLLEAILATVVDMSLAAQRLRAITGRGDAPEDKLWQAILTQNWAAARDAWPKYLATIRKKPLLYVPLGRGGNPRRIAAARIQHHALRSLAVALPRLGLLSETWQLLATARKMETDNPVGGHAVSEYDRLFSVGHRALAESVVDSARAWPAGKKKDHEEEFLVDALEQLTEASLQLWLQHSRTLRLSVLERVGDDDAWHKLDDFVKKYGKDIFTQHFLQYGNVRGILQQGVSNWLKLLAEEDGDDVPKVVRDLDQGISLDEAATQLEIVLEAIVENYSEYRDYNSTTTQSDRGDSLYLLLDFIRLRVHYDRIEWHLRPVLTVHDVLLRYNCQAGAERWRRTVAERTTEIADRLDQRLAELQRESAMRLLTISDRLAERFVRPLQIDRMRALIPTAWADAQASRESTAFTELEAEADQLRQEPHGAGLEVPLWLRELAEEVDQALAPSPLDPEALLPIRPLSAAAFRREMGRWEGMNRDEED